jgi:GTP 3',8-cyclase
MSNKKKILDSLKVLVTDGCNLSCIYCVPELQTRKPRKKKGLKHSELLRLVRALVAQGIVNIDIRGGEPLTKKWIYPFLEEIERIPQIQRVSLLTNGVVLKDHASELHSLGLKEVGIHIDSLNFEKYMKITRGDHLYRVYAGLQEAETANKVGFERIKIYVMVLKGFNNKEILDFALLTKEHPYEVVFLEYHPHDAAEVKSKRGELRYPVEKIEEEIDNFQKLLPVKEATVHGKVYRFEDGFVSGGKEKGLIRFLSPTKYHKCDRCTRIFLTTDGLLSPCFLVDKSIDLQPLLDCKEGQEIPGVLDAVKKILRSRPRKIPRQDKPFRLCSQFSFLDE